MYPDPEPPKDLEPFPSFTYHMGSRQDPLASLPLSSGESEKSHQETSIPKPTRQIYTGYPPRPISAPVPPKHHSQQSPTPSSPPTAISPQPIAAATTVPLSPSPVFILFLTCLHHIVQQHPSKFEFNDYLLVVLARAGSGGLSPFGDFLYNSERERTQDRMRQRTPSIWKWIQTHRGWFTNRDYMPPPASPAPSGSESRHVMDDWRKNVLAVQTGGRYTALWSEYYFNATPPFLPDTRTILLHYHPSPSSPLSTGRVQVSSMYKSSIAIARMDKWHASMFDEQQRKQFTFPGVALGSKDPMSPVGARSPGGDVFSTSSASELSAVLPPELTQLRGEEMHLYYMLVMHLRSKRREKVKNAFLGWQRWAKRRREERPAREAGWGVVANGLVSGSSSGLEDDGGIDTADEESPRSSNRMRTIGHPELTLVAAAKKGVEVEMARVIESSEQFFGRDIPLQYEDISDDEVDYTNENEQDLEAGMEDNDEVKVVHMSDADLEDAFDDFGFPVTGSEDPDVFIAV